MCAGAISLMGVKSVFYGCSNDKFGGCGSVYAVSEEGKWIGRGKNSSIERLTPLLLRDWPHFLQGCGTCSDQVNLTQQGFKCRKGLFAKEAITMLQNFYIKGNARGEAWLLLQPFVSPFLALTHVFLFFFLFLQHQNHTGSFILRVWTRRRERTGKEGNENGDQGFLNSDKLLFCI